MRLEINGESRSFEGGKTVAELIEWLKIPHGTVLVEHNGTALHLREWQQTWLADGDRIELLHVVAGG